MVAWYSHCRRVGHLGAGPRGSISGMLPGRSSARGGHASCSPPMSRIPPPSHFRPRTREGRIAVFAFVALFALCMPPVTHLVWDRPGEWIAGWPAFFVVLFLIYSALVGVLLWTLRKEV